MAGSRVTSGSIRKPEINTRESMGTYLRQVQRYLARPWRKSEYYVCFECLKSCLIASNLIDGQRMHVHPQKNENFYLGSKTRRTEQLTWSIQKYAMTVCRPPGLEVTVLPLHRPTRLHPWVTRRVGQLLPMSALTPNAPLTYDPSD